MTFEPNLVSEYKAPKNKVEENLHNIWAEILKISSISVEDSFFDLGGDSIKVVMLSKKIKEAFRLDLPIKFFYEKTTIRDFAYFLQERDWLKELVIDFTNEAILDPSINIRKHIDLNEVDINNIFFTGATGYIGSYLLYELLKRTKANIYCLVRGSSLIDSEIRLESILKKNLIWQDNFKDRIITVVGDLSKPLLGLTKTKFEMLSEKIDVIYHTAADVNFSKPYSMLKPSIVLGTQEILKLSVNAKTKPIHHVSTIRVFGCSFNFNSVKEYTEDINIDSVAKSMHLDIGYDQAKWVAEKLIFSSKERGIPVTIYRPGFAVCHSIHGIANIQDFWARMTKGCIEMGVYPSLTNELMEFCTVDYISKAIACISLNKKSIGKVFHITPPRKEDNITTDKFFNLISKYYKIKQVNYHEWVGYLFDYYDKYPDDNPLLPLSPLLTEKVYENQYLLELYQNIPHKNCDNTLNFLENSSIKFVGVNIDSIENYIQYLVKCGYIGKPFITEQLQLVG